MNLLSRLLKGSKHQMDMLAEEQRRRDAMKERERELEEARVRAARITAAERRAMSRMIITCRITPDEEVRHDLHNALQPDG